VEQVTGHSMTRRLNLAGCGIARTKLNTTTPCWMLSQAQDGKDWHDNSGV